MWEPKWIKPRWRDLKEGDLEKYAMKRGISMHDTGQTKHGKTGLDEAEIHRRLYEADRAVRERWYFVIAILSAIAAWVAAFR
jgi:hypothetical protein